MEIVGDRRQILNLPRTLIVNDEARKACIESLLDRHFDTIPPVSYGAWAHNTMNGFVRKSLESEPGCFTLIFFYWSSSDTYRRVDLHFSEDGAAITPKFTPFLGPQLYHIEDCLRTLDLIADGSLCAKDYNRNPINPTWKSPSN